MELRQHIRHKTGYTTRKSHLRHLGEMEEVAWDEFYAKYRAMIAAVGKRHGLSPADRDDLMQQVTAVMCDKLQSFVYEPEKCRFRSFLHQVAVNLSHNIRRKELRAHRPPAVLPEFCDSELDREFLAEYENYLLERSLEQLKRSMDSGVYLAFEMLVLEERPVAEVAALTGKTAGALYNIRHRGLKNLRAIIADIRRELESPGRRSQAPEA